MFTMVKEDRAEQRRLDRSNRVVCGSRLRTRAELSTATSCYRDRIPPETQRQASSRRLSAFLRRLRAALREWRRRRNGRLELARLDERMLRDIGLTRCDAEFEINKPFWRE